MARMVLARMFTLLYGDSRQGFDSRPLVQTPYDHLSYPSYP